MSMTLIQLRVFCAVVEQGSFRAAARMLGIAQSTLTQAMQSLERELDVALLNRSHQGVSLTPSGEKLLVRANSILLDCDRAIQDLRDDEQTGHVAIGLSSEPLAELLLQVVNKFKERFPRVQVHVSSGYSKMLMEKIRDGRLDFAVCPLAPQVSDVDVTIERLYRSRPCVIARRGHPRAHARSIIELADCEWVGLRPMGVAGGAENRLNSIFRSQGLPAPKVALTAESLLETLHIVADSDYLTVEPSVLANMRLFSTSLIAIDIEESFDPRDICLVSRRNVPFTGATQALASMLISYARLLHGPLSA